VGRRTLDALREVTEGRFELLQPLGQGGMGSVVLVRDIHLDLLRAIKALKLDLAEIPDMRDRFLTEARTQARLQHPNIVPVFSVDPNPDLPYFVMQYVPGRALQDVLRATIERGESLQPDVVCALLHQAGSGIAHAHKHGVVHRDIKPSNILLNATGTAVVTDFGIAKVLSAASISVTGSFIGTPPYMSPEQCRASRELTGASDQYSLGIVAYELLAGRTPFQGPGMLQVEAHKYEAPTDIRHLRPDCPRHVAMAVMKMLAKDPLERFPSVMAALHEMRARDAGAADDDPLRRALVELAAVDDVERTLQSRRGAPQSPAPVLHRRAPTSPVPASPVSPSVSSPAPGSHGNTPAFAPASPAELSPPALPAQPASIHSHDRNPIPSGRREVTPPSAGIPTPPAAREGVKDAPRADAASHLTPRQAVGAWTRATLRPLQRHAVPAVTVITLLGVLSVWRPWREAAPVTPLGIRPAADLTGDVDTTAPDVARDPMTSPDSFRVAVDPGADIRVAPVRALRITLPSRPLVTSETFVAQLSLTIGGARVNLQEDVRWSSSDSSVVQIGTQSGVGRALAEGNARLIAVAGRDTASHVVHVVPRRATTLAIAGPPRLEVGGEARLSVSARDQLGSEMFDVRPRWSVGLGEGAAVDADGVLRGVRRGVVTVIAHLDGLVDSLRLEIEARAEERPGIDERPDSAASRQPINSDSTTRAPSDASVFSTVDAERMARAIATALSRRSTAELGPLLAAIPEGAENARRLLELLRKSEVVSSDALHVMSPAPPDGGRTRFQWTMRLRWADAFSRRSVNLQWTAFAEYRELGWQLTGVRILGKPRW